MEKGLTRTGCALIAATLVCGMLAACTPTEVQPIESVTFSQSQAIESFDDSEYMTSDDDRIADLTSVLEKYGVTGDYNSSDDETCPTGTGISTLIEYATTTGTQHTLKVHGCDFSSFEDAVHDLVSEWRLEEAGR